MKSALIPIPVSILLAVLAWSPPPGAAQAPPDSVAALRGRLVDSMGTVRGRVILTPQLIAAAYANVIVLGTRRGAAADDDGRFVIERVPVGRHPIRLVLPGIQPPTPREFDIGPGMNDLGELEMPTHLPPPVVIGSRAEVQAKDLEATIRPSNPRIRVGDAPAFVVRIRNRGAAPALLPSSVDASDDGASPLVKIEIDGPVGGFVVAPVMRCGNNNGVRREDFAEVAPGEEFDPYRNGWLGIDLRHGKFVKPGRYTATFRYDTTEQEPRRWMAGPCGSCKPSASLIELLEHTPAVQLSATTTFEVVK